MRRRRAGEVSLTHKLLVLVGAFALLVGGFGVGTSVQRRHQSGRHEILLDYAEKKTANEFRRSSPRSISMTQRELLVYASHSQFYIQDAHCAAPRAIRRLSGINKRVRIVLQSAMAYLELARAHSIL